MRTFECECGARIFFDNTRCLSCNYELGFRPDQLALVRLTETNGVASADGYHKCANYSQGGVCNWLVADGSAGDLCEACRLNNVIPDLTNPENQVLWAEVESAKRRLIYGLNRLHLAVISKIDDPETGLSFDIKADQPGNRVLTGHDEGLITLNLAEADPSEREKTRLMMKERYRTLLGHFRHEVGHYYWDRLVRDTPALAACREIFGDESIDYGEALKRHYANTSPPDYSDGYISSYAASHPWEDFAETFAHYLHLHDTLETAEQYGFAKATVTTDQTPFSQLMRQWRTLTVAHNALNRSMGLPDAYPFAISNKVEQKLDFVHRLIHGEASSLATPASAA